MTFFQRIRERWLRRRDRRHLENCIDAVNSKVRKVEAARQEMLRDMKLAVANAEEARREYDLSIQRLNRALEQSEAMTKKQYETIEALQEQLKTATELTIPTLVAAHSLAMHRFEHESQILALRSGAIAAAQGTGS